MGLSTQVSSPLPQYLQVQTHLTYPDNPSFHHLNMTCPIRVQLQIMSNFIYWRTKEPLGIVRGQTKCQLNTWLKLFLLNVAIITKSCKVDFAVPSPPFIPMWIREIFVWADYKYFLLGLDLSYVFLLIALVRDLAFLCQDYLPYFLDYFRTISSKVLFHLYGNPIQKGFLVVYKCQLQLQNQYFKNEYYRMATY